METEVSYFLASSTPSQAQPSLTSLSKGGSFDAEALQKLWERGTPFYAHPTFKEPIPSG